MGPTALGASVVEVAHARGVHGDEEVDRGETGPVAMVYFSTMILNFSTTLLVSCWPGETGWPW